MNRLARSTVIAGAAAAILTAATLASAAPGTAATTRSTNGDWATLMLSDGGFPTSYNNITVVLEWLNSEHQASYWYEPDEPKNGEDGCNPLDDSYKTGTVDGTGVYNDLYAAATNTSTTINDGDYVTVVADLKNSAAVNTTATAIQNSPWASSHYGHGSQWHYGSVTRVAARAQDWSYNGCLSH